MGARRRVGLGATVLLGLGLGYNLGWHLVRGGLPSTGWVVSGVLAVVAAVLALATHRAAGPRWDLRACLGLCVVTLAVLAAGASFVAWSEAATAAMMALEDRSSVPWAELSQLVLGVVALVGSWPALSPEASRVD